MKHLFLFLFTLSLSLTVTAQNKKAIKAYEDAVLQLRDGLIKDAIPLLGKAIEYDPEYIDAYLSLAGVYGELKNYQKAIYYYDIAKTKDSIYFLGYLLPYSINLAGEGRFTEALEAINRFLSLPNLNDRSIKSANYRKQCYTFAIDYAAKHPESNYRFNPVNLGDEINTANHEYYPSITINDSLFVFTRRTGRREDFYESTLLNAHNYSKSQIINGSINEEPLKGAINISQDGEWLIFAGDFGRRGYGSFDLYISYMTPEGWSEPVNMGPEINTEAWETSPSLSPDKNALYFTSTRFNGYGGSDIYVSYRLPNGKWSKAVNMGPKVNTPGDELAPFIHADNNSLYFTSNGHPGYGGSDIFLMRRKNKYEWNDPENLGYPINTIENEGSVFIAANGVDAYFASDRADSRGGLDLYRFELRPDIRPAKTLYVQGFIMNARTKSGIPAAVELTDNTTGTVINSVQSDETGFYFITLPTGKDYTFSVNRKGYLFYTEVYALSSAKADSTYKKNILLQPVELNTTLTFKNIQFQSNAYTLDPVSFIELDKLLQLLNDNPSVKILISGHTDNTGNAATNLKLSEQRAKAVADYLVTKGIDAKRISYKGFGSTHPVANNNTEEGKAANRRTEFKVIGM